MVERPAIGSGSRGRDDDTALLLERDAVIVDFDLDFDFDCDFDDRALLLANPLQVEDRAALVVGCTTLDILFRLAVAWLALHGAVPVPLEGAEGVVVEKVVGFLEKGERCEC